MPIEAADCLQRPPKADHKLARNIAKLLTMFDVVGHTQETSVVQYTVTNKAHFGTSI
jgi:hypothetical protein